jgi:hypothetical protein
VQEAGWTPKPVWTEGLEEKLFASAGDRKEDVLLVKNVTDPYSPFIGLNSPAILVDVVVCRGSEF